jgi:hypothetical protein
MNISRRTAFAAIVLPFLLAGSAQAAGPNGSWDGTWAGAWGGKQEQQTSITIAGKRVVSYEYQGVSHPVSSSKVSPTKIVYDDQGVTVTLTRTGNTTASAALHSDQGDATAELTRQ